jgi:hypothetical protein
MLNTLAYWNFDLIDIVIGFPIFVIIINLVLRRKYFKQSLLLSLLGLGPYAYTIILSSLDKSCRITTRLCAHQRGTAAVHYLSSVVLAFVITLVALLVAFMKDTPSLSHEQVTDNNLSSTRSSTSSTVIASILIIIEVLALMSAGLALFSLLFGVGFLIEAALIYFLAMNLKQIKTVRSHFKMTTKAYVSYLISILLAGMACGFGAIFFAEFGNAVDGTKPATSTYITISGVALAFVLVLVYSASYWQSSKSNSIGTVNPPEKVKSKTKE